MSAAVTWLMPVKNGMPFLPKTLASIAAQTFRDAELLVWDNGSTDGTVEELRKWIPGVVPGRIIDSEPLSLGVSLARLVETAQSELCARIDADDVNYPERLAKQVGYMNAHPQVGLLGTQIEFINPMGEVIEGAWEQDCADADIRWRMRWQGAVTHSTAMFRRSIVLAAGNYTDTMPHEDHDLWLRIAQISEVANLPTVLVQYRLSANSVTGRGNHNFDDIADRAAKNNASILFPGIEPEYALELRSKAQGNLRGELRWRDVLQFRKAAIALATKAGKPRNYFTSTARYRLQRERMITGVRLGTSYWRTEQALRGLLQRRPTSNSDVTRNTPGLASAN